MVVLVFQFNDPLGVIGSYLLQAFLGLIGKKIVLRFVNDDLRLFRIIPNYSVKPMEDAGLGKRLACSQLFKAWQRQVKTKATPAPNRIRNSVHKNVFRAVVKIPLVRFADRRAP
jgi:hypothetical protein